MYELRAVDAVLADWSLRQSLQPLHMFRRELFSTPERRQARDRIEVMQIHQPAHGFVVISADKYFPDPAAAIDHFIRARTIADDVAQINDSVMLWSGLQASLQGFKVAMNVT